MQQFCRLILYILKYNYTSRFEKAYVHISAIHNTPVQTTSQRVPHIWYLVILYTLYIYEQHIVVLKARGIEPVVKMGSLKFKMEEGRWLLYARAAIQKTSLPPIPSLLAASFLAFKHTSIGCTMCDFHDFGLT